MKETFEVFKFDDGKYFEGFRTWGIQKSDTLTGALWIGNAKLTDRLKNLKGKLVTVTISDEELPTTITDEDSTLPTLSMVKLVSGYTDQTIASKIGVGKSTVHDWLNGKKPSKKNQKKLCDFIYKESTYGV